MRNIFSKKEIYDYLDNINNFYEIHGHLNKFHIEIDITQIDSTFIFNFFYLKITEFNQQIYNFFTFNIIFNKLII